MFIQVTQRYMDKWCFPTSKKLMNTALGVGSYPPSTTAPPFRSPFRLQWVSLSHSLNYPTPWPWLFPKTHFSCLPVNSVIQLSYKELLFCLTGRLDSKPHNLRIRRICLSPRLKCVHLELVKNLRVRKLKGEASQEHWRTKQTCPPQRPGKDLGL